MVDPSGLYTISRTLRPLLRLPLVYPAPLNKQREQSVVFKFMSSTGRVASTSSSGSNVRLILEAALAVYSRTTGIDLFKNRFAAEIGHTDSPEGILQLLQERVHAFKEFRNDNQRLTSTLIPAIRVLHALSGNLGEAVGTVSHTYHLARLLM